LLREKEHKHCINIVIMNNKTNTLGWDTVSSIPIKYINQAIVALNSSPPRMSYIATDKSAMTCDFDHWQISSGGKASGQEIKFMLPCKNIKVSNQSSLFGKNSGKWAEVKFYVSIYLQWVAASDELNKKPKVKTHHLVPRTSKIQSDIPVATYIGYKSDIKPLGSLVTFFNNEDEFARLVGDMLINWLCANLDKFTHIFAFVDLNKELDKNEAWAWCKPTDVGYAYLSGDSPDSSLLGVLCMTGGRKAGELQSYEIDQNIIPQGSIGGYLISDERFLLDLILPTLPQKFTNAKIVDWSITNPLNNNGKYTYTLTQKKSFKLDKIDHNGRQYQPMMTKFDVSMEAGYVEINTSTSTVINEWVTAYCDTTHKYHIFLDSATQTLGWKKLGEPLVVHHVSDKTPEGYKIAMDVIGAVLAVIITISTDGAGIVLGAIVAGIFTGLANVDSAIAASNKNISPDPSAEWVSNIQGGIKWSLGNSFHLKSSAINGPLQLGFDPHFSKD